MQSIPSLFSHQTSCFKPTSGWQIITAIKAGSWKWTVISPVGTSSSIRFPHLWVWYVIVPAINSARCSFSVSADPVQPRLHWQILTAPPSPLSSADVTGCGGRLASSAYPWTVTVLNGHVKLQCSEAQIPCDCLTKSMPDDLDSDPSLVYSTRSIHVGVSSSDRLMQQGRCVKHLGESRGLINSYSMRKEAEWERMQYLQLCEFIQGLKSGQWCPFEWRTIALLRTSGQWWRGHDVWRFFKFRIPAPMLSGTVYSLGLKDR